ncbi:IS701 family transposase [Verrucosispora sp. SN26_14.1]|uniref:IS701 family transposase n=1 Tax=Verrucosispora sp. SN26_14.1 TaxID=2527879 RepID=UPI001F2045E8|nr:IS701 family transposase [Verrucosispora sp. SN26_14.1]
MEAGVGFATKPALGLRMVERAVAAGLPARWVTADEAYGQDSKFRTWLQQQRVGYVLAVPRNQRVPTTAGNSRPDVLAAAAPALAWKGRSCGDGAKGPRLYDWAVASLPGTVDGYGHWLLIRRSITDPTDLAYYLCFGPAGIPDEDLIRIAGTRWAVEECFQTAKTEVGLDHYQVRRYDAWYRHITLVLCAHAYLTATAAQAKKGGTESDNGLIPLTLGEVRRLLAHLITTTRPFDHIHRWSRWRRRHQYRARTAHYQRRLQLHQVRLEY